MYIQKLTGNPVIERTNKPPHNAEGSLSEAYLDFLNPYACRFANPYSSSFWKEMKAWLASVSNQAEGCQKSSHYRDQLAPYRLRRVHLTAGAWAVAKEFNNTMQLCLTGVRLTNVYDPFVGCTPNVYIDHINLLVSNSWFDRVAPDQDEALSVNGMLYEYVNSKGQRNIGIIAVAVMPQSRRNAGLQKPERDMECAA